MRFGRAFPIPRRWRPAHTAVPTSGAINPVGSLVTGNNVSTLAVHPTTVGDVLVVGIGDQGDAAPLGSPPTGGGVLQWNRGVYAVTSTTYDAEIYWGVVTTAGASTITLSRSVTEVVCQQFTHEAPGWIVDGVGAYEQTLAADSGNLPSVIPEGAAELYVGFAIGGVALSGSSGGFTYAEPGDSLFVYDTSVSSPTTIDPDWTSGSNTTFVGVSLLLIAHAPAPLAPIPTYPPNGSTVYFPTTGGIVNWDYESGGALGGETGYYFKLTDTATSTVTYWDASTQTFSGSPVANTSPTPTVTFPFGSIADGSYTFEVASIDAGGTGPYCAPQSFTLVAQADVTVTAPTGDITTGLPTVEWTTDFPSGLTLVSYQVRTFTLAETEAAGFDPATSAAYDDSGILTAGAGTGSSGTALTYRNPQTYRNPYTYRGILGSPGYTIRTTLTDGTYVSYVNVIQTGGISSGFIAGPEYTVGLPGAPDVTVLTPVSPVTTSLTPSVTWETSFASGQTQLSYRVITYSQGQYEDAGFVPGVGTSLDDSGVITSPIESYRVSTPLENSVIVRTYVFVTGTAGNMGTGSIDYTMEVATLQLPTWQVEVAFTSFLLADVVEWFDVTDWMRQFNTDGGRQHVADRPQASTCTMTFDDRDGRFTPYNSASPYSTSTLGGGYGLVPGKPFRILGTDLATGVQSPIYYGFVDSWTPTIGASSDDQDCVLNASDVLKMLANAYISNPTLYPATVNALNPSLYWRLNDGPGTTTCVDLSPNDNLGIVNNDQTLGVVSFGGQDSTGTGTTALLTSDYSGGGSGAILYDASTCATFDCQSTSTNAYSGYIAATTAPIPLSEAAGGVQWSATCLFQGNSGECEGAQLWHTQCNENNAAIGIYNLVSGDQAATGQLCVAYADEGGDGIIIPITLGGTGAPAMVNDGNWHQLTVTMNDESWLIALNGLFIDVFDVPFTTVPNQNFFVGQDAFGNDVFNSNDGDPDFTGFVPTTVCIQDVALFSYQLSTAEVQNLRNVSSYLQTEQYTGQRIDEILTICGYLGGSFNYPTDLAIGTILCQGETTSQTQVTALDYILNTADTELGFFYQGPDGILNFRDANWISENATSNTSQQTWADNLNPGVLHYLPAGFQLTQDDLDLFNQIQVQAQQSNTSGELQQSQDLESIQWFGLRCLQRTGMLFANDSDAAAQALTLLTRYHMPVPRVQNVTVGAESDGGAGIGHMLARQFWDQMTFGRKGPTEAPFLQPSVIEGTSHSYKADPGQYHVTWHMSPYEFIGE